MNDKITLPNIIQLLALKTGDSKKQSEDFIKEFFNTVASVLDEGEQIKIKSFGVFKTVSVGARKSVNVSTGEENQIPAHRKVVFTPSKEIAAIINEPFEMFETVEINPEVVIDESEEKDESVSVQNPESSTLVDKASEKTNINPVIPAPETETKEHQEDVASYSDELYSFEDDGIVESAETTETLDKKDFGSKTEPESNEVSILPSAENKEESEAGNNIVNYDNNTLVNNQNELNPIPKDMNKNKFGFGFIFGFLCSAVICCLIVLFVFDFDLKNIISSPGEKDKKALSDSIEASNTQNITVLSDKIDEEKTAYKDSSLEIKNDKAEKIEVPTQASDEKVYDMITKTRYLTTMAKDHYGNYHLWPYIYEENKHFLGHPDRIKPGTKIVIPSLSKYGVDPKNPKDIEKAKKKGVEIYSRYK